MLATFSPEGRIKRGLEELRCPEYIFAKISGAVGKSRLAEGLAGRNDFDNSLAERLLETLKEMQELQSEIDVPIDWGMVNKIQDALVIRRIAKIEQELGGINLETLADRATKSVAENAHGAN